MQCNGASQRHCYSRRDLKPVNQRCCWQNEPRSFQKGEHTSGEEKSFWRSNEVRETFCKRLRHNTKNTEQSRRLLLKASVTPLVVSKEADDLLSAVAGNQTNIECWTVNCKCCQYELMSLPVDVSTVPSCPLLAGCFSPGPYIHHSILRFEHMVILTKIPNPHHQQAEWTKSLRTSRQANPVKAQTPPQNTLNRFSLCSAKPQRRKKKRSYIFENLQS